MESRQLERLGAGLMVPSNDYGRLGSKLRAVVADRSFARAAEHFAGRYRDLNADAQGAMLYEDLADLMG